MGKNLSGFKRIGAFEAGTGGQEYSSKVVLFQKLKFKTFAQWSWSKREQWLRYGASEKG